MLRIGCGFDVHAFADDRDLIIGGVHVPYTKGLAGHSDADVLTHAICDALLGAAGMPDIGVLFPDTDDHYKNADSLQLLKQVMQKITTNGGQLMNIDSTLAMQAPKIASHTPLMRERLAQALSVSVNQVNIKATTTEKLGFVGREEGVAAYAVALLDI